ncbi:UxaA family hydrolase [Mameliella alba]|nr:UxaA family hydrolase [Mameliella alba]MBY6168704.1 UxaA family hydrolase [Mameliella alba]MBY6174075.1 UxaA family hydrolase [Mameliella alba]
MSHPAASIQTPSLQGYHRPGRRPGSRSNLLVLNLTGLTEQAARRIATALPGAVLVSFPYGMGVLGPDAEATRRALTGLANHPNTGAVLLISADRSRLEEVQDRVEGTTLCAGLALDSVAHDALRLTAEGIATGARLMREASRQCRQPMDPADIVLAVECGLSDPTSGIAANPLIGRIANRVVDAGGTVIMGETLEWLGVEAQLAARARTPAIAARITKAVTRRESLAVANGIDLAGINPNRRNIEEGLTTIEEKASGSVAKSGSHPVEGVLAYAEPPSHPGLWVMDAPSYTPESLTGLIAAGAQLALFSTGSGNSYVSALCPTIKISANARTVAALDTQIDFDASPLMTGADPDIMAKALWAEVLATFNGAMTWGEVTGEGNEVISRFGEAL